MFGKKLNKVDLKALVLVLGTVVLGLASAMILKEATLQVELQWQTLLIVGAAAAFINGIRFVIWGFIHKHYPLSLTYPLSSLFFPLIFLMGYFYGEEVTYIKLIAVGMIACGVGILTYEPRDK